MCYLVLCEQSFSKRLAYSFLEDLQTEFSSNYGSKVETVSRPYSFIEFGKFNTLANVYVDLLVFTCMPVLHRPKVVDLGVNAIYKNIPYA